MKVSLSALNMFFFIFIDLCVKLENYKIKISIMDIRSRQVVEKLFKNSTKNYYYLFKLRKYEAKDETHKRNFKLKI